MSRGGSSIGWGAWGPALKRALRPTWLRPRLAALTLLLAGATLLSACGGIGGSSAPPLTSSENHLHDVLALRGEPGAVLSPFKNFDPANYPNDLIRSVAKIGTNASVALFDGSDAMPAQVGTGSFWKEMTKWISGQENLDAALKNIDDSWPSS